MANWTEIKQRCRGIVHSTFGIPASFHARSGTTIAGSARLHYKMKTFGDLDREGFAQIVEDIDYVVIDSRRFVCARERDKIHFPGLNRTFALQTKIDNSDDGIFVRWQVQEDRVP